MNLRTKHNKILRFGICFLTMLALLALPVITNLFKAESQITQAATTATSMNPEDTSTLHQIIGLPIQQTKAQSREEIKIIPGGQSIGVQLQTKGVLVVGHHLVKGKTGGVSPGEKADIQVGDVILEIDGKEVKKMKDVKPFVKQAGQTKNALDIKLKRGKKTISTELEPALDEKENNYQIGLYIRDSAAGIGTMTFYDPNSKKYGALGHVISDMDTQKPIEINNGSIVRSSVTSIEKGNNGIPGEKQATFSATEDKIGSITKNTAFGIFGKLNQNLEEIKKPLPIAQPNEVKEGPAKILTVLAGEEIKEYEVEVVSSVPQKNAATKGMVIQIKDKELLSKTGGIVQGMSGSPIIQNGKIIGAVTHVFVNDPTSGYGVHIKFMLEEAGINTATSSPKKVS
ncbi:MULTISPECIES: SpoIVB peptidase [Virgibacillus]|uniref:Stage IV sporulation protein B n=1 Tax=Virgibacillus chiguensis TaxID=411959 RepID=A0A1M5LQ41_9BACI|nr:MULTISPECIES: SpoIVB peptidase [Virgibacillus]SHG67171.1 stage IV sporulation protein B [Virgibacillus chiguensis]